MTFFKLLMSTLGANKFRTFLIILSVSLSTALLYGILSMSTATTDYYEDTLSSSIGTTDIVATVGDTSNSPFNNVLMPENVNNATLPVEVDITPIIQSYGYVYQEDVLTAISLNGMTLEGFDQVYDYEYLSKLDQPFEKDHLLLGETTANQLALKTGDIFDILVNNASKTFTVYGIVTDENMLKSSETSVVLPVIIHQSTAYDILSVDETATTYLLSLSSETEVSEAITLLEGSYKELTFTEAIPTDDMSFMLNMLQTSLSLMGVSVLLVSAFIIFASFKVIAIERMPLMGTIRSLGATKKSARFILMMESILYGIIGGLLGIGIGIGLMQIVLRTITSDSQLSVNTIYPSYALISLASAMILVLLSSLSPIISLNKRSVRSLLFIELDNTSHYGIIRSIAGLVLIVCGYLISLIQSPTLGLIFNFVSIITIIVGGILVVPFVSYGLVVLINKIFSKVFGTTLYVIKNQVKQDKSLLNNITLMAIGLAVLLMINSTSSGIGKLVVDVYGKSQSEIIMFGQSFDDILLKSIEETEGVTDLYANYETYDLEANDGEVLLSIVDGVDLEAFLDKGWNEFGDYIDADTLETFESGPYIITSQLIAHKNNLEIGDTLSINFDEKTVDYELLLVVPSIMNNGQVSFIDQENFTNDTGINTYRSLYIKTDSDANTVIDNIKKAYPTTLLPLISVAEMEVENQKSNDMLFNLLRAVSILAMGIGLIGIFNNYVISFMGRKKFIASLRSLGVRKVVIARLLIVESLIVGLIGSSIGAGLGMLLFQVMKTILTNMNIPGDMLPFSYNEVIFILSSGILMAVISALLPVISLVNKPIVASIKYE